MVAAVKKLKQTDKPVFGVCPVENALKLISGKWKPVILFQLSKKTYRFGELERSIPGINYPAHPDSAIA